MAMHHLVCARLVCRSPLFCMWRCSFNGAAYVFWLAFTACDRKVAVALAMHHVWFVTGWCAGVFFCSAWSVLLGGGRPRSFLCPVCLGVRDAAAGLTLG